MKFVRFSAGLEVFQGVLEGEQVKAIEGDIFGDWGYNGKSYRTDEVKFLSPLTPNQVIGIGANYVTKTEDLPDEIPAIPVFFYKPVSSVIGPEEAIIIPEGIDEVKFESELAVVIGKEGRNIAEEDVLDYIFGFTVGNDVTAPQFFHKDGHWTIGKSFDTFTPLGPVIETELDPANIRVKASLNGVEKQNSPTDFMIVPLKKMISYLSTVMTLKPGDVILTGSPAGAVMMKEGDVIECRIEGIGSLENRLASARKKDTAVTA